jgi:hypothetical protein
VIAGLRMTRESLPLVTTRRQESRRRESPCWHETDCCCTVGSIT